MKTNRFNPVNPLKNFIRQIGITAMCCAALPVLAQTAQVLYSTPPSPARDNYTGGLGCQFRVGPSNVIVSHVGVFDIGNDGLAIAHNAGVFNSSGSTLLGQASVPAGTGAYLTNGFRWMPLDPPVLLASNTTYLAASVVVTSDGDTWQDAFTPTWNTFFVGASATTTRHAMYGPGGTTAWPPASFSANGNNNTYGNVSLGYIEIDQARVGVQQTNVALSAGQTLSILGFASGQAPISYQWYSAPSVPVLNQTNAELVIPNATVGHSGTYFLTASNSLGGQQSANVTVSVTSFPVGITQHPTNVTVFANYPFTMSITATGSPPISLQWSRNSNPIPGATNSTYAVAAASSTNNSDIYSCLASNFTSGTAYTATSSNATLTVIPNLALPQQFLHGARANTATNNFFGLIGGRFLVGNNPALVTHLGYYASQFTDAGKTNAVLTTNHHVGIFSADGSALRGSVLIQPGTNAVINGYIWAPLDPPLVLSNNTTYLLVAEVFSGTPAIDPWGDAYAVPDWNPYFTGVNSASAGNATYWGAGWPNAGVAGGFSGQMYSAPNLAILALNTPTAFVAPTNVTQYVGFDVSLTAVVEGQAPLTVQWYKQSGILLPGQTNQTLTLTNVQLGDSGNYYVVASNTVTAATAQSADAVVNIIPDVGPTITQDISSQNAFVHQTVRFAAAASGTPTLNYQWTFNGNPIPGATSNTLTLTDVSAANAGNYQLGVTNNFGSTNSSVASLAVTVPAWGTYSSPMLSTDLLAYYRFSDSSAVATNQGSLGSAYNGTYEGGATTIAGPTGFSNFEVDNMAVSLDGLTTDVLVPPLGVTVSNLTMAAWVYKTTDEGANTAIYFHRGGSVFGMTVVPDPVNGGDSLRYTWNAANFGFVSGLVLPTNQWALVAVAITPTNASLYLQDGSGLQTTNNVTAHPAGTFNANSYVGWDTAGGTLGRRWNGMIDEVMIFKRALSAVEVNALYLGVPGSATLDIARAGSNVQITWPGGKLLEATTITGPWTTNNAATSPYTVPAVGAQKYYRVQLQP